MTRIDFALFTALNLAGWALLNVILGPYGPDRQAHAWALLQKGGFIAFALEWTYLSASFNRAADAGIEKFKFFWGYVPGRVLYLYSVMVVPSPGIVAVTFVWVWLPVALLLLCGTGRWLPGMLWPSTAFIGVHILYGGRLLFFPNDYDPDPGPDFVASLATAAEKRRQRELTRRGQPSSPSNLAEDRPAHPGR